MLIFTDLNGSTVYLPAAHVSHWVITPGGSVRLWAVGGPDPIHPADAAGVLAQLQAGGLLPEPGTPRSEGDEAPAPGPGLGYARHPPSVEPLASPPEPAAAPRATPRNRRKA